MWRTLGKSLSPCLFVILAFGFKFFGFILLVIGASSCVLVESYWIFCTYKNAMYIFGEGGKGVERLGCA